MRCRPGGAGASQAWSWPGGPSATGAAGALVRRAGKGQEELYRGRFGGLVLIQERRFGREFILLKAGGGVLK